MTRATRDWWLALLAILAVGTAARLYHYDLTIGSDDQRWIITARELGRPHESGQPGIYYARILYRLALNLWGRPWGLSLETSAGLMLLLSALSTALVAATAGRIYGARAGLFAAAVVATDPLHITYDALTLPDGLAGVLLLGALLGAVRFLEAGRAGWLILAGILTGLSFSAKEYCVLFAGPLALCLATRDASPMRRSADLALLGACVALGLSADALLHIFESGDGMGHLHSLADYGARQAAAREAGGIAPPGLGGALRERAAYLFWLIRLDPLNLPLGALGLTFLLTQARRRPEARLIVGAVAAFAAFLLFMPASRSPFLFVEMQPRYLLVLTPMVAIGVGGALASVAPLFRASGLGPAAVSALALVLALDVLSFPDPMAAGRRQEFAGLRDCLRRAGQLGVDELILPAGYESLIPDRFRRYGVRIGFRRGAPTEPIAAACPGRAYFVPSGEGKAVGPVGRLFESSGYTPLPLVAPTSTYRAWLDALGLPNGSPGTRIGVLYLRAKPPRTSPPLAESADAARPR